MQRTRFVSLFAFSARPFGRSLALLLLIGASAAAAQTPSPTSRSTGGPTGGQSTGRKLAGDTVGFTLTEAINYGLDNAVSMRQAVLTMQEAKERKREVLARGLPQLNAALGYTHYVSLPTSILPPELAGLPPDAEPLEVQFGVPHNASASAELSQLVFDGAYFLGIKATNMLVDIEAERTKLSEIDLRHNITQAYYTGLIAGLRVRAVERNIDLVDNLVRETAALNEQGFVENIEVDRLRRSRADLDVVLSSAQRDHELALRMLKYTMNYDQRTPIRQLDGLDSLMLVNSVEGTESFTPEDRLEYRLLLRQEETNKINVRYNRNEFLPKLTAFASYEQQAQRESFNFFDFDQPWFEIAIIGANLNIPIFDGFYKRAQVEKAKIQLEGIRLQQEMTAEGLKLEVAQARSNYLGALERLESQRESRDLAERIYEVSRTKYMEGVGSSLELTTAQQDFQTAEDTYIGGLYEVLAARADFIKALGRYPTVMDFR